MARTSLALGLIFFLVQNGSAQSENCPKLGGLIQFKDIIHEFVGRMCHAMPSLNIPALAPFVRDDPLDISFNNSMGKIVGSVSNIRIEGLSGVKFPEAFAAPLFGCFKFQLGIPEVSLKGAFKASGIISDLFTIDGNGYFDITISSVKLSAGGFLKPAEGKVYKLTRLYAQPSISQLKVNIQKLVANNDVNEFINKALNKLGPQLLQDMWADYGKIILSELEKNQAHFMKPMTFDDLIHPKPIFPDGNPPADCLYPHN